jgi:hypothetical protein
MYLSEEVASLCSKAALETDSHRLLELTKKINELLEKEERETQQNAKAKAAQVH